MTPQLTDGKAGQATHIDMLGVTLSFSFIKPGSSFTLGTVYSMGSGKGQPISGQTSLNDVSQKNIVIYLTGSYQL